MQLRQGEKWVVLVLKIARMSCILPSQMWETSFFFALVRISRETLAFLWLVCEQRIFLNYWSVYEQLILNKWAYCMNRWSIRTIAKSKTYTRTYKYCHNSSHLSHMGYLATLIRYGEMLIANGLYINFYLLLVYIIIITIMGVSLYCFNVLLGK